MSETSKNPKDITEIERLQKPDLSDFNPLHEKINYLENRIKLLESICAEINPYESISNELKLKLLDFNILDLNDPFKVTNSLLMLLEDTIDDLHILKPYDETKSPVKEIL